MKLCFSINVPNWLDKICSWPALVYRKCKYGYPFRRIRLTEGKFALVDQRDFYWLNNFDWVADGKGDCIYAAMHLLSADDKAKIIRMHRYIVKAPPDLLVDHRNGDGIDNRRDNLRLATHSQNTCNRKKKTFTSSKYIGVCLDKQTGKWRALIMINGKSPYLGRFDSEIDAAKAYDEAAKKYHGEFARLNFPEAKVPEK